MSNIVLKVRSLTKKFGTRTAVDNISFDVYEGEIFGFLGPNGAGKTTALRMICGLAKPTNGDIFICNKSIRTDFEKAIRNVGGIIENPEMYKNFTGLDNLKYYASLYKNIDKKRINEVVKIVGLEDRIKDKLKVYSLGMKQRLGIAQALLHSPKLLILDEPTNGLDPNGIIDMRNFLKKLATEEKIAILVSSHILAEMELMCDTVGIISNGKLKSVKSVESIKTKASDTQTITATVNFPNFAGKLIINKFNPEFITIEKNTLTFATSADKIPEITLLLVSNGISIYSIHAIVKSLEDIFLETINRKALNAPKDSN